MEEPTIIDLTVCKAEGIGGEGDDQCKEIYVRVVVGNQTYHTPVKDGPTPEWNTKFPAIRVSRNETITIAVMDPSGRVGTNTTPVDDNILRAYRPKSLSIPLEGSSPDMRLNIEVVLAGYEGGTPASAGSATVPSDMNGWGGMGGFPGGMPPPGMFPPGMMPPGMMGMFPPGMMPPGMMGGPPGGQQGQGGPNGGGAPGGQQQGQDGARGVEGGMGPMGGMGGMGGMMGMGGMPGGMGFGMMGGMGGMGMGNMGAGGQQPQQQQQQQQQPQQQQQQQPNQQFGGFGGNFGGSPFGGFGGNNNGGMQMGFNFPGFLPNSMAPSLPAPPSATGQDQQATQPQQQAPTITQPSFGTQFGAPSGASFTPSTITSPAAVSGSNSNIAPTYTHTSSNFMQGNNFGYGNGFSAFGANLGGLYGGSTNTTNTGLYGNNTLMGGAGGYSSFGQNRGFSNSSVIPFGVGNGFGGSNLGGGISGFNNFGGGGNYGGFGGFNSGFGNTASYSTNGGGNRLFM